MTTTATTQRVSATARAASVSDELRATVQHYVGSTNMITSGIDDLITALEDAWLEAGQAEAHPVPADACTHKGDWTRDQYDITRCDDCGTRVDPIDYL
ncbi:MAG: hypothetical protein JWQ03_3248 [Variovorax sp.]|nr:hypothetical protein [Variovorax sp.]